MLLSKSELRIAWKGADLFDSIEEDGMTLTARACYHMACEIASAVRRSVSSYVPEPWQDNGWASGEFSNEGQRVRFVISMEDENKYVVSTYTVQGLLRTLFGRKAPAIHNENVRIVTEAIRSNPRFEILAEAL